VFHIGLASVTAGVSLIKVEGCPTLVSAALGETNGPLRCGDFPAPKMAGLRLRSLREEPPLLSRERAGLPSPAIPLLASYML
jgi:hypothetical protein